MDGVRPLARSAARSMDLITTTEREREREREKERERRVRTRGKKDRAAFQLMGSLLRLPSPSLEFLTELNQPSRRERRGVPRLICNRSNSNSRCALITPIDLGLVVFKSLAR